MNAMSNSTSNNGLVLAFINLIYLLLSVILLWPALYQDSQALSFTSAYGVASGVYSLGILYGAFEKVLLNRCKKTEEKFAVIAAAALSIIHIALTAIYYFLSLNINLFIWIGYFALCITAVIALFQAILAAKVFSKKK